MSGKHRLTAGQVILGVVLTLALTVLGASGAQDGGKGGPPPAKVRVGVVKLETVRARREVVGRLREVRRATVAAERRGRVIEVRVEEGDLVHKGKTVLARLDDTIEKLDLAEAEAALAAAHANIAVARADFSRAERQYKYLKEITTTGTTTPKEVGDAADVVTATAALIDRAKASMKAAQARVERAHVDLRRSNVVAPFDGVVVRKITEVGQWLDVGDAVAEVISRGSIDALIDVPERIINHVEVGEPVELRVEAVDEPTTGKVFSVTPLASTAARTFPVRIRFDDASGRFKSGMSVSAQVPTGREAQLLTVPRSAVQRASSSATVWANAGGKAMPVPVRVLFGHGDRYTVQPLPSATGQTLTKGMQVVIEGAERLFPFQPLQIVNPPASNHKAETASRDLSP